MSYEMYSREWWKERLPLISAFVDGEKIIYGGVFFHDQRFAFGEDNMTNYTIAPKTITVNGFEVHAPETVEPKNHKKFFYPALEEVDFVSGYDWDGDEIDLSLFSRGLVYLNKDHAIARAKAMLGIDPAEDCK